MGETWLRSRVLLVLALIIEKRLKGNTKALLAGIEHRLYKIAPRPQISPRPGHKPQIHTLPVTFKMSALAGWLGQVRPSSPVQYLIQNFHYCVTYSRLPPRHNTCSCILRIRQIHRRPGRDPQVSHRDTNSAEITSALKLHPGNKSWVFSQLDFAGPSIKNGR